MRSQEKHWYFLWKRACHCYGAGMAFYPVPTEFLLAILCALKILFRCSQCIYWAFTSFALRWRRVKDSDISKEAILQSLCKCHGRPRCLHCSPCVCQQSSNCVVGDFTAWLWWWPYSDRPHCTLTRKLSDGICFEHAQSGRPCSAFYMVPQSLLAMVLCYCIDVCDRTAHTLAFYILTRVLSATSFFTLLLQHFQAPR